MQYKFQITVSYLNVRSLIYVAGNVSNSDFYNIRRKYIYARM
jgi:hypothetical protein